MDFLGRFISKVSLISRLRVHVLGSFSDGKFLSMVLKFAGDYMKIHSTNPWYIYQPTQRSELIIDISR